MVVNNEMYVLILIKPIFKEHRVCIIYEEKWTIGHHTKLTWAIDVWI